MSKKNNSPKKSVLNSHLDSEAIKKKKKKTKPDEKEETTAHSVSKNSTTFGANLGKKGMA